MMRLVVSIGATAQVRDWPIALPHKHRPPSPVVFRQLRGRRPLAPTSVGGPGLPNTFPRAPSSCPPSHACLYLAWFLGLLGVWMAGTVTAEPKTARRPERGPKARSRAKRRRSLRSYLAVVRPVEAEALLVLALFGFAMVMRWPNLMRLPHFTDEIGEIRWTLGILHGEHFPLTAQVKYFGPVHHYIVALCFWIFGPSLTLPRTIVCVIGALTVVLTYLIGREVAGWRVGALGAALLATLPQHIVVNSH